MSKMGSLHNVINLSLVFNLLSFAYSSGFSWSGTTHGGREKHVYSTSSSGSGGALGIFPPGCSRIECPSYDVIQEGSGYEIRRYNSTMWTSTSAIQDISFVEATRAGFLQLFDYIQGKNEYNKQIEMTAPVLTQVLPSDGPFCESSFVVSFYLPKENQADPPPAQGLHVQVFPAPIYAAVRQFSGFVSDSDVGEQAAALQASLSGTVWAAAVERSRARASRSSDYAVAQYNSPFEFEDRVNEIWLMFDMEEGRNAGSGRGRESRGF